jgi:integrase
VLYVNELNDIRKICFDISTLLFYSEGMKNTSSKKWQGTQVTNLIRNGDSGIYYARISVGGKQKWKSLRTPVFSTAKMKLPDEERRVRSVPEAAKAVKSGRFAVNEAMEIYRQQVETNDLSQNTREFYLNGLKAIKSTWPSLASLPVKSVSRGQVEEWLRRLIRNGTGFVPKGAKHASRKGNSASTVRAALSALRETFKIAVENGARYDNPVDDLRGPAQKQKELNLPSREQFADILTAIRNAGAGSKSIDTRDLVAGLAYSGMRIAEAGKLTWAHIDFEKQRMAIQGTKSTSSKRTLPMNPALIELLKQMRSGRVDESQDTPVFRVKEAQKAINSACKKVGATRITHHDLRHLFATSCIENGIDIPTVSRWLGHKDGGALAMKTYGHLRDEHSAAMALKVNFHSQNKPVEKPISENANNIKEPSPLPV